MIITYVRGALYGWAAGFLSDQEFETEARRSDEITPKVSQTTTGV